MSGAPADSVLETTGCPLGCSAGDARVLAGRDHLFGMPGEWTVVRCLTCGLMRTSPRPAAAAMAAYYPASYGPWADTRVGAGPGAPARRSWAAPLNQAVPEMRPGRLLEVGCGAGAFLAPMKAAGWEVRGLEPSAGAARDAVAAGLDVRVGTLESGADLGGPYDLIAGWMVAEHLHEPVRGLARLRSAAAPDAWLALSVPDAGSIELAAFGEWWYALQLPTHLFHYTPHTLALVLGAAGWRLERVMWQRDCKNLLRSLRLVAADRGLDGTAGFLEDMAAGRRLPRLRAALGVALGLLRSSGRITVWARAV